MALLRVDRFISERTGLTRSEIKKLIASRQITVDGVSAVSADTKIDPFSACVCVSGERINSDRYKYLILNKPSGYVCSASSREGRSVMELIPDSLKAKDIFPSGRLDKDSEGLLLMTNDGGLTHRILSPKNHVPKIYIVKLADKFQDKYVDLFAGGHLTQGGDTFLPARVRAAKTSEKLAFVEICEGKFHQVKRMFSAVGNNVEKLVRISVGGLFLPEKLAKGQCMELLHKDVEKLCEIPDPDIFFSDFSEKFSAILINKR